MYTIRYLFKSSTILNMTVIGQWQQQQQQPENDDAVFAVYYRYVFLHESSDHFKFILLFVLKRYLLLYF